MNLQRKFIMEKLNENPNGFFSMVYVKADGSIRHAVGRLHVSNPSHALKPGTGKFIGESAEDAYKNHNNLKYFDCNFESDSGRGAYRTAKIDRIQEMTIDKVHYTIVD